MKLSNKAATRIATLVNSLAVAEGFITRASRNKDAKSYYVWLDQKFATVIRLDDEFGIQLPGLARARAEGESIRQKANELIRTAA